ncbi:uncharacterized protein LOC125680533 [Ostrea edulis]|uniref:uncharacterized protein LOC125680533 n=1 Tax=Ostrea edulis TaxID=37623 RepID=UPI002096309F|nr:uncharacterized protein LOC125680533 [Ostrea edulis]
MDALLIVAGICCCIGCATSAMCQSGELEFFSYPESPFPQQRTIKFKRPFNDRPVVMYCMRMIDSHYNLNTRANIRLLWVRPERFSLRITAAHDSQLYGLGVSWMACP